MAILIISHHLIKSLKDQYLTIANPLDLWTELKNRDMITKERCYYQRLYLIGGSPESRTISPWMSLLLAGHNNGLLMRNSELRPPGTNPLPEAHAAVEAKKESNHVQSDSQHGRGRGKWHGRGGRGRNSFGRGQGNS